MAIFCVTGNSGKSVEITADIFILNGISKGQDAHRGVDISMAQWHAKALASIPKSQSMYATGEQISANSRKLAIDILSARNATPDWFWAETQSVRFLQFWKGLDPNIRFILTCADINSHLIYLLEQGELSSENVSDVISEWCELTIKMLSFHLSNPSNAALIPVNNCADLAYQALQTLNERWNLGICGDSDRSAETSDYINLTSYIATQILIDYPEACDLDKKLQSLFKNTDLGAFIPKHKQLKLAIDNLQYLSRKEEKALKTTGNQITIIKKEEDKSRQLSALETDKIALQERFSALAEQHGKLSKECDKNLEDLLSENEFLSSHLHNCQESLERNILINKELTLKAQATNQALVDYARSHREHCYYESFDITVESLGTADTYLFVFKNLYLIDRLIPLVRFTITASDNALSIRFTKGSTDWLQSTGGRSFDLDFICDPTPGSPYLATNVQLTELSTSSWDRLIALIDYLLVITKAHLPPERKANCLSEGLARLSSRLNNWPAVFRYDRLTLLNSIETGLYQRLEAHIENMSAGMERWPSVRYNIATVESSEQTFGKNPRLEFPESAHNALSTWHPEIVDQRGSRCELRFAQPNAMDLGAWKAMSGRDQLLVVALISSFGQQVKDMRINQPALTIDSTKWIALMSNMKFILSNNISKSSAISYSTLSLSKAHEKK